MGIAGLERLARVQAEQASHGEAAEVFGQSGYFWSFMASTMENWQSEFLQLLSFVVLTAFLLFRGSPESKDGDDEIREALRRIEERLAQTEQSRAA